MWTQILENCADWSRTDKIVPMLEPLIGAGLSHFLTALTIVAQWIAVDLDRNSRGESHTLRNMILYDLDCFNIFILK